MKRNRKSKIVNINVRVEISYLESTPDDEAKDIKDGIVTASDKLMFVETHASTGRKVKPINTNLIKDKKCEDCGVTLNYVSGYWECWNDACLHNDLPF